MPFVITWNNYKIPAPLFKHRNGQKGRGGGREESTHLNQVKPWIENLRGLRVANKTF